MLFLNLWSLLLEKPILWHIMSHFSSFGFNDFYIALGYKGEEIKKLFSFV